MSHPANDYYFESQKEHVDELMAEFISYADHAKALTCAGYNFITVHEAQIHAANTVNAIREAGLLDMAKEMYPEERENIKDYLDIYDEVKSGVKV